MVSEICAVGVSEIRQSRRALDPQRSQCGGAQIRAGKHGSVIGEADEACVEGSVPQCRAEDLMMPLSSIDLCAVLVFSTRRSVGSKE